MWQPVPLPYKSITANVTLPTPDEIRACQTLLHERYGSKIVAVDDQIVVKYGRGLDALDGQALVYLERHVPGVPAPRLYAMYYDSEELFVVMQRVPGVRLDGLWPSLTNSDKDSVVETLRCIFDRLRQTEPPRPPFFGGLDGGAVRHYLFYSQSDEQKHLGPFCDKTAFVKGLTANFRALKEGNSHPVHQARFYESHLPHALRDIRPVLTHGDVQRKNIIVAEKESKSPNGERTFDIVLVDWEMAGWLPEFWEYFCVSMSSQYDSWEDDWFLRVGHFLAVRLAETAVMRMFDKDMGP